MGEVFIPTEDGRWVNADFERLARVIKDYAEVLELRWIPYDKRNRDDKAPYVVVDTRTNSAVLHATELDTPEEILARLFMADNTQGSVLDRLEAHNRAVKAIQIKKWLDESEERQSQTAFLIGSPLNYVNFNGKKLDDKRRPVI